MEQDLTYDFDALPLPLDFYNNDIKPENISTRKKLKEENDQSDDNYNVKNTKVKTEIKEELFVPADDNSESAVTKRVVVETSGERKGEQVEKFQCKYCSHLTIRLKSLQRHLREVH